MTSCYSCGGTEQIVLSVFNSELLVECVFCHVRWTEEEKETH